MADETPTASTDETRCAQCGLVLAEGQQRQVTEDGAFCLPCFENLKHHLHLALQAQGENINYPMAAVGAILGGVAGILVWWGFTVATQIAFGLVAVVIGWTVGKGAVLLAGRKRSRGLQILSVAVAGLSFLYASYLVNRSFVQRALSEQGDPMLLPLLPAPELFLNVVRIGFGIMDLVFLAIVLYQAWQIPAPIRLPE